MSKKKSELIAENEWLQKLPLIPRLIIGMIKYNLKEILFILVLIFLGLWLLTAVNYKGDKIEIKSGVRIDIVKEGNQ